MYSISFQYWSHKQQLDDHSFPLLVQWETLEKALAGFPPAFQMWPLKFASKHLAVATTMLQWKQWDSNLCPLCHTSIETTQHVLACSAQCYSQVWTQQLHNLQQWFIDSDMSPAIRSCIMATLAHRSLPNYYYFTGLCWFAALEGSGVARGV